MVTVDLNTIKSWFKRGLYPKESQFAQAWDSFWHKSEGKVVASVTENGTHVTIVFSDRTQVILQKSVGKVTIANIEGLQTELDKKDKLIKGILETGTDTILLEPYGIRAGDYDVALFQYSDTLFKHTDYEVSIERNALVCESPLKSGEPFKILLIRK